MINAVVMFESLEKKNEEKSRVFVMSVIIKSLSNCEKRRL